MIGGRLKLLYYKYAGRVVYGTRPSSHPYTVVWRSRCSLMVDTKLETHRYSNRSVGVPKEGIFSGPDEVAHTMYIQPQHTL